MEKTKVFLLCIFALSFISASATAFGANTLHVPGEYANIQDAIDAAATSDTIVVADGTYLLGIGREHFDFNGKAITVKSENGPENCIIDCQGNGSGFWFQSGEGQASELSGFTVKNANGTAIVCKNSAAPIITDCILTSGNRGVHCSDGASPTIRNCTITDNSGQEYGGGIYLSDSSAAISECLISNNTVTEIGGGIYVFRLMVSEKFYHQINYIHLLGCGSEQTPNFENPTVCNPASIFFSDRM